MINHAKDVHYSTGALVKQEICSINNYALKLCNMGYLLGPLLKQEGDYLYQPSSL